MKTKLAAFFLPLALTALACGDDTENSTTAATTGATTTTTGATSGGGMGGATSSTSAGGAGGQGGVGGVGGEGGASAFVLTSSAFMEGAAIPEVHECEPSGDNTSPPFSWTAGPTGTLSYAIVMRDLDFQNGFLHWIIWDIPATVEALPADVEQTYEPADPAGAKQAPGPGGDQGYFGPCSPNSINTYEFTLYAIDVATLPGLDENSSIAEAEQAIVGAAIASTTLAGES